jgi:hypothetical protein
MKLGEKLSEFVAGQLGTWRFVILLSSATAIWISWNVHAPKAKKFDPYPFVALNLCYSFLAGYTAPILLMSASRQAAADRNRSIENLNIDRADHARIDSMLDKIRAMEESLVEAVLHKEDASGRQPKAVCSDCGAKFGLWYDSNGEYIGPETHFSTYKTTKCEVCGKIKPCTEAQDYGNLRLGWKREVN